jgi:hypothetical protein
VKWVGLVRVVALLALTSCWETGEEIGLLVWPMFAPLAEADGEAAVRLDGRSESR